MKSENNITDLTKAEEQVMQILWGLRKGFVKEIVHLFPDPKPAYNTISTIVRILEKKQFIGHKAYGKTHEYFPLISKKQYSSHVMNGMLKSYFNGSISRLLSFFSEEKGLDVNDMNEIKEMIKKNNK